MRDIKFKSITWFVIEKYLEWSIVEKVGLDKFWKVISWITIIRWWKLEVILRKKWNLLLKRSTWNKIKQFVSYNIYARRKRNLK